MSIQLKDFSTKPPADYSKSQTKIEIKVLQKRLRELQYVMRAQE